MSRFICSMHAIAVRRGEGLLPELAALLERRRLRSELAADSKTLKRNGASTKSHVQKADAGMPARILSKTVS